MPVLDGSRPVAHLDMGWEKYGVAVDYEAALTSRGRLVELSAAQTVVRSLAA